MPAVPRPVEALGGEVPFPWTDGRAAQRELRFLLLAAPGLLVGPDPIHGEGDGCCDYLGELHFLVTESVRRIEIEHEFAEHAP